MWASFGLSRSVFIAGCDIIWEIPFGSESDTALSSRDPVSLTGLSENRKLKVDVLIIFSHTYVYVFAELYLVSNINYFGSEIVHIIPEHLCFRQKRDFKIQCICTCKILTSVVALCLNVSF